MKRRIYFLCLLSLLFTMSCTKEKDANDTIPIFRGITTLESEVGIPGSVDATDWRTDDTFTELERSLFDTLNFDNSMLVKSAFANTDVIIAPTILPRFFPNPVRSVAYFLIYDGAIKNMIIVDQSFTKKIELREESTNMAFDLTSFKNGIYRMYYVLQDSNYKIIGLGHGDILVDHSQY